MSNLLNLINEAVASNHIHTTKIPIEWVREVRGVLVQKYVGGKASWPLWNYLVDAVTVRDDNAWLWIADFLKDQQAVLLFDEEAHANLFSAIGLEHGSQLTLLLGDLPLFEFYVTNRSKDYLICFSHHDILYACGSAADWLRNRVSTTG